MHSVVYQACSGRKCQQAFVRYLNFLPVGHLAGDQPVVETFRYLTCRSTSGPPKYTCTLVTYRARTRLSKRLDTLRQPSKSLVMLRQHVGHEQSQLHYTQSAALPCVPPKVEVMVAHSTDVHANVVPALAASVSPLVSVDAWG
jgi:hypothetical protein